MNLVSILIVLIIVGVVLYLVNNYIPMAAPVKTVINVVAILLICLWLLNLFGLTNVTIPVRR